MPSPQALRYPSHAECERVWDDLRATELPSGRFVGKAWSEDLPWVRSLVPLFWLGKVFKGTTVKNIIRFSPAHPTKLIIPGEVWLAEDTVWIEYVQLGLQDRLRPRADGRWLGQMRAGTSSVWFTLTPARAKA